MIVSLPWFSSEQASEVFLCHSIRYSVTTEPLGTLHKREMEVAVVDQGIAVG